MTSLRWLSKMLLLLLIVVVAEAHIPGRARVMKQQQQQQAPGSIATAVAIAMATTTAIIAPITPHYAPFGAASAAAANLPSDNGAIGNKRGTLEALQPIVRMRDAVKALIDALPAESTESGGGLVDRVKACLLNREVFPASERAFKRLFDEYSNAVTYQQKFIDQNAFLVYYTQGFDGPNRPRIDAVADSASSEKLARNEVYINFKNAFDEIDYLSSTDESDVSDLKSYLDNVLNYLNLYVNL